MGMWIAAVLFGYLFLHLFIVTYVSRNIKSEADYLLAGRKASFWLVGVSLFATWFGAETVMGSAAGAASEGLSAGRADPFGYTICLVFLGLFLAAKMREKNYFTISDFFNDRFGAGAGRLSALILLPTSLIWASAQILALGSILSLITLWPMYMSLCVAVGVVIAFTCLGGMKGDMITDAIQGGVIVVGVLALLWFVIEAAGGPGAAFATIESSRLNLFARGDTFLQKLDGWMIPILGALVAQESMSRMLSTKSPEEARKACFLGAGLYFVIGVIPLLLGMIGSDMIDGFAVHNQFLPTLALQVLPAWLYIVFLCALVAAIISTLNSTLLSAASLAGHNIINPLFLRLKEKKKIRFDRIMVVLAGMFCYGVALAGGSVFDLVAMASAFGSTGVLVCVLFGLHSKFGSTAAAVSTMGAGVLLTMTMNYIWQLGAPYLASVLGCVLVYSAVACLERWTRPRKAYK